MSKLMRISTPTSDRLESLSKLIGESKQKIMDKAIKIYANEQILKKANAQDAKLKKNPGAWAAMQKEIEEWDVTVLDGLEDNDY